MSELINTQADRVNIRRSLLATASVFVLAASAGQAAHATDSDRPTVWIEGGWHFDKLTGSDELLVPPLDSLTVANRFPSVADIQNTLGYASGAEGNISFQPKGSDWVFTASARYGRTRSGRHVHKESEILGAPVYVTGLYGRYLKTPSFDAYVEQSSKSTETHTIADFQVGKDVGLGLFGHGTESVVSLGARYVQMNNTSQASAHAAPDAAFSLHKTSVFGGMKYYARNDHHNSVATAQRHSSLHALGPSISWSNTTALLGDTADGQLAIDWGVNAAVLFGRQRAKVHHQSANRFLHASAVYSSVHNTVDSTRSRSVTIPNLGGFAGLSYRFPNAKLSAGYRADFFFGAMDRGLDTHKSVTTGFNGPFATIAIGLGG